MLDFEAVVIEILHRPDVDSFEMAAVAKQVSGDDVFGLYKLLIENHFTQIDIDFTNDDVYQTALKMYQILKEY